MHELHLLLSAADADAADGAAAVPAWEEPPLLMLPVPQVPVKAVMMERSGGAVVEMEV